MNNPLKIQIKRIKQGHEKVLTKKEFNKDIQKDTSGLVVFRLEDISVHSGSIKGHLAIIVYPPGIAQVSIVEDHDGEESYRPLFIFEILKSLKNEKGQDLQLPCYLPFPDETEGITTHVFTHKDLL